MSGIVAFVFLTAFVAVGHGWTYEAETDVQACRDLLTANMVTVYADGDRYILTNVLTGAYIADEQPTYLRGTRTQKLPKEALQRMARKLEEIAGEMPENYADQMEPTADDTPAIIIRQAYIATFIFVVASIMVATWMCSQRTYRQRMINK